MSGMHDRDQEGFLIQRIVDGEAELFGDLLRPYLPRIQAFAHSKLRNEADAEDAVQQATLKAFSHLKRFRRESSFFTWLARITLNEIYQVQRNNQRRDSRAELDEALENRCSDPRPSVLETLERTELSERLSRFVASLPERLRVVVLLRHVEGLAIRDIAARLKLTQAGVKTRLHRGRRQLAAMFPQELAVS